ncbi:PDR/VanB family oxidoreductase [Azospirillum sp. SYSU D00513]|uniref:PDR/VanB family oxidoreductase n=1 Tax=Azospirillum sp. SYSU D00513 TaxID=2812561 RepID=UPI001A96CD7F|nr:PDR/VanB family oxidoreductase [Azospirillum sp. SYSU D00513]
MRLLVRQVRIEAEDIRSFELADPEGAELAPFTPGAHIDVRAPDGPMRQYSLCNGPEERDLYRIAVKREPWSRGGSRAMHGLQPGQFVEVSAPRDAFPLDHGAPHCLLLAAGIGITPLLSMARHLAASGRSFALHHFTRSPRHAAFLREIERGPLGPRSAFHHGLEGEELHGTLGRLLAERPAGALLYLCGPAGFMAQAAEAAAPAWPAESIRREHFAAPAPVSGDAEGGFSVELARTGRTVAVPPDRSIVAALAEQGVRIDTSCEQGVCGTCLTRVLAGEPDHRDLFLSEEERRACDQILPCVSRARGGRLVLDL